MNTNTNSNPGGFNIGDLVTTRTPAAGWGAFGFGVSTVVGFCQGEVLTVAGRSIAAPRDWEVTTHPDGLVHYDPALHG